MHGLDAFVISTGKIVGGEDIFGIIIPNFKEAEIKHFLPQIHNRKTSPVSIFLRF